ncbi:MAG: Gfo/Idh/MocA family oxidoreductase [candidate division KSB1 bacterium]|nr:Gfo/Idh/MocA family oxidoreductase [candidate division KSB1 bacterium]
MHNVGIVGVGKLGNFHCRNLSQMQEARLVGVNDSDAERMAEISQTYNCKAFETPEALIDAVDVVGIIVPTTHHLRMAKLAIKARKPVFVEKPIAASVEEAQEMVDLAETHGVPLQVGHIERFNPAIQALDPLQFEPKFIESHRLSPFNPRGTDVAVILDLMIHDIDIILSLVKSELKDIRANGVAVISDQADIANARLEFESGCVANVTASRISQRTMRKMRVFQPDSYISIDFFQRLTEIYRITNQDHPAKAAIELGDIQNGKYKRHIVYEKPTLPEVDAMQSEWRAFFTALDNNEEPVVSGRDGLKALQTASCIGDIIDGQQGN